MKINYGHRIKARLDITVGLEPREPGEYLVLDADYNVFIARWNGEYFVGDHLHRPGTRLAHIGRHAVDGPGALQLLRQQVGQPGGIAQRREGGGQAVPRLGPQNLIRRHAGLLP